jgi:hypothetical protein
VHTRGKNEQLSNCGGLTMMDSDGDAWSFNEWCYGARNDDT